MNNSRNNYGVKDASKCYRNINGNSYEQWTDTLNIGQNAVKDIATKEEVKEAIEQCKAKNPNCEFKAIKYYPEKMYRIYRKVNV